MTRPERLDEQLRAWLREEAETGSSHYLEETLALLERAPQRRWRGALTRTLPAMPRLVVPRGVLALAMLGLLVAALAVAAVIIGSRPRLPAPFGLAANGLIAYDDGDKAYIAQADGSDAIPLTGSGRYNHSPTFSPDGTLVAFWSSNTSNAGSLFVAAVDGSTPPRNVGAGSLLGGPQFTEPAWAPDSQSIAYPGWAPSGKSGIYVASVDTGEARHVAGEYGAGFPAWSPDGQWIAFRACCHPTRLMLARPDGSDSREVAAADGDAFAFDRIAWTPDSSALVYHRPDTGDPDHTVVAVYHLLERDEDVISRKGRAAHAPAWSTDGTHIAYFEEDPDVPPDASFRLLLIVASSDGAEHRSLGAVADCSAYWSPDSKYLITFPPGCDEDRMVIVPVDGSPVQSVALPGTPVGGLSWQRIALP